MNEPPVWPMKVRTKTCPRCGEALICGPRSGEDRCWCDARPHVALSKDFGDCLCPDCLDDEIERVSARIVG